MAIPEPVSDLASQHQLGEVRVWARALFDLTGSVGETYVVTDGVRLLLSSRALKGEPSIDVLALKDIELVSLRWDRIYLVLEMRTRDRGYSLNFSSWHQQDLESLRGLWAQVTQPTDSSGLGKAGGPAKPTPIVKNRMVTFCSSLFAMGRMDGHLDQGESLVIARTVNRADFLKMGIVHLEKEGVDLILQEVATFDRDQQACLIINLLGLALSDGVLRSLEQELAEQFRAAMSFPEEEFNGILDVLMLRHRLAVFGESETASTAKGIGGDEPLLVFSAALHSLSVVKRTVPMEETDFLVRLVEDPDLWQRAEAYYESCGSDGILARMSDGLSEVQRECLLANLYALGFSDGTLDPAETELIDEYREAMGIDPGFAQQIRSVFERKYRLEVFDGSAKKS